MQTSQCQAVTGEVDAGQSCSGADECSQTMAPICEIRCRACIDHQECVQAGKGPYCADGQCAECTAGSSDCEGATPICADGVCRGCASHEECSPNRCSDSGECVECLDHEDCASRVCDRNANTCVPEANIRYVSTTGVDMTDCGTSAGTACKTIGRGLLERQVEEYLFVGAGIYAENIQLSRSVSIVAPDVTLLGFSSGRPGIYVIGQTTAVTVDGLTAEGARSADALLCDDDAAVVLSRTRLLDSDEDGLDADCDVTIDDSVVRGSAGWGIRFRSGQLTVSRSVIRENTIGGMLVQTSSFRITNNVVVGNGQNSEVGSGGVRIASFDVNESDRIFAFNTVADNTADSGLAQGVMCDISGTDYSVTGNIVYNPARDDSAQLVSGTCVWSYSNVENYTGGTANIDEDPAFAADDSYHILSDSPCRSKAAPAASVVGDIDGDPRPDDDLWDIGADQFVAR